MERVGIRSGVADFGSPRWIDAAHLGCKLEDNPLWGLWSMLADSRVQSLRFVGVLLSVVQEESSTSNSAQSYLAEECAC